MVARWLDEIGLRPGGPVDLDEPVIPARIGQSIPDMPDRIAVVTVAAGSGDSHEGVCTQVVLGLLLRGPQNDPEAAERMALETDRLITFSQFPRMVADVWLVSVARGMRPVPIAEDDADRTLYQGTYRTTVAEEG